MGVLRKDRPLLTLRLNFPHFLKARSSSLLFEREVPKISGLVSVNFYPSQKSQLIALGFSRDDVKLYNTALINPHIRCSSDSNILFQKIFGFQDYTFDFLLYDFTSYSEEHFRLLQKPHLIEGQKLFRVNL